MICEYCEEEKASWICSDGIRVCTDCVADAEDASDIKKSGYPQQILSNDILSCILK